MSIHKLILNANTLLMALIVAVSGCITEDSYKPQVMTIPVLSASSSEVVLNQKLANETGLTITWTPGSNYGTNAGIDYTLQVDKQGNSFANAVNFELGRAAYQNSFKVENLNDLLLNSFLIPAGEEAQLEFRVISKTVNSDIGADLSNVVSVKIKPYEPVLVPANLYMVGDAAEHGWDAANATPMIIKNEPGVYTYSGMLNAGELKFLTTPGEWLPSYQKGADDNHIVLRTDFGQPDDKFVIPTTGTYAIVVDVIEFTISITALSAPPYAKIWMVGDAAPSGWNIDNPTEMKVDPSDPFIFTFSGVLKPGEFKFPTSTGNWATDYYMPLTNHPDLTATSVQLVTGGAPDYKWQILNEGAYKIKLDLRELTVSITPFTPYTNLWIIGDAGPNGWNIDSPTVKMTGDGGNMYVYTYTGAFNVGEFKIALGTGDWCGQWIRPLTNHPSLDVTSMQINSGCGVDNKWQITEAGTYSITLNQLDETIQIVKQ